MGRNPPGRPQGPHPRLRGRSAQMTTGRVIGMACRIGYLWPCQLSCPRAERPSTKQTAGRAQSGMQTINSRPGTPLSCERCTQATQNASTRCKHYGSSPADICKTTIRGSMEKNRRPSIRLPRTPAQTLWAGPQVERARLAGSRLTAVEHRENVAIGWRTATRQGLALCQRRPGITVRRRSINHPARPRP